MGTVTDLQEARTKRDNADPLFQLMQLVKGYVRIDINEQRVSYETTEQRIKGYPLIFEKVPKGILETIIKANTLVEIVFTINYPGKERRIVASTLEEALKTTLSIAKNYNTLAVLANKLPTGHDCTQLLSELGKTCRASVHLTAQPVKDNKEREFEIQAYTLTPIGFASVDGRDLDGMLASMLDHAKTETSMYPVK